MKYIPADPATKLTRDATSLALIESGFPVTSSTLATYAVRGGGPSYQKFGRRPLYVWADVLAWAESKLSRPVRTTSEAEAA